MRCLVAGLLLTAALVACDSDEGRTGDADGPWTLDVAGHATEVHVTWTALDDQPYRASSAGLALPPTATTVDARTVTVNYAADSVDITLDTSHSWAVRISGATDALHADATRGALAGLTLVTGVAVAELTLGAPHGRPVLRADAGFSSFLLDVPDGTGVRVHTSGGAQRISLFGDVRRRVGRGATVETPGFGAAGYVIETGSPVYAVDVH